MATSTKEGKSAAEAVRRLFAACGVSVPDPPPLLVHRLDAGTSGVVLLAKTPEAHRAISLALQERRAKKTYRALVWGHPVPAAGTIDLAIQRDPKDGRKMRVSAAGKAVRYALRDAQEVFVSRRSRASSRDRAHASDPRPPVGEGAPRRGRRLLRRRQPLARGTRPPAPRGAQRDRAPPAPRPTHRDYGNKYRRHGPAARGLRGNSCFPRAAAACSHELTYRESAGGYAPSGRCQGSSTAWRRAQRALDSGQAGADFSAIGGCIRNRRI